VSGLQQLAAACAVAGVLFCTWGFFQRRAYRKLMDTPDVSWPRHAVDWARQIGTDNFLQQEDRFWRGLMGIGVIGLISSMLLIVFSLS
jgi:hypothetical protein